MIRSRRMLPFAVLLASATLAGCATMGVEPWERDLHARADMKPDERDAAIDDHIYLVPIFRGSSAASP